MSEPMVIPALYAPPNPNCATTCCVSCHMAPQECGPHCWSCAQHWADMAPIPGVEDAIPATEPSEDDRSEYAREDAAERGAWV